MHGRQTQRIIICMQDLKDKIKKKKKKNCIQEPHIGWVWIALKLFLFLHLAFFYGSCTLFTRPANMDFNKSNFKTKSHGTIHTFKNYFATVFLVFSNKWYPNRPINNRVTAYKVINHSLKAFNLELIKIWSLVQQEVYKEDGR